MVRVLLLVIAPPPLLRPSHPPPAAVLRVPRVDMIRQLWLKLHALRRRPPIPPSVEHFLIQRRLHHHVHAPLQSQIADYRKELGHQHIAQLLEDHHTTVTQAGEKWVKGRGGHTMVKDSGTCTSAVV